MHLLSLLSLSPVASLPDGGHFDVDLVRPMNGTLCFGDGVDKGGSRLAPFGEWLVTIITVGSPNLVAHGDVWDHQARNGLNRGQFEGLKRLRNYP